MGPEPEWFDRTIADLNWTFAKTMPWIPHWYVVRDRDVDRDTFKRMVRVIWAHGRVGHWGVQSRQTHLEDGTIIDGLIYLERREWRYWTMGYPIDEETIINREQRERAGIRWADEEGWEVVGGTSRDVGCLPPGNQGY